MPRASAAITVANRLAELERVSHIVEAFGARHDVPAKVIFEVNLALDEILTNVIGYAYDDRGDHAIAVRLGFAAGVLTVEVEDDGRPFNPLDVPAPDVTQALEHRPVGGLGVHLVRRMMSGLVYRRERDKNILIMTKLIDG